MTAALWGYLSRFAFASMIYALGMQVPHAYMRALHSSSRMRRYVLVYESALFVHIAIMCIYACGALTQANDPSLDFPLIGTVRVIPLLWANVVLAAIEGYAAIAGIGDTGEPESKPWLLGAELLIGLVCTPPVFEVLGNATSAVVLVVSLYYTVRTTYLLVCDHMRLRRVDSPLSVTFAMKLLPEGILYADESGAIVLENNVMRRCLTEIGISGDGSGEGGVWERICQEAQGARSVNLGDQLYGTSENRHIARIGSNEIRLFERSDITSGMLKRRLLESTGMQPPRGKVSRRKREENVRFRVIAYDVTDEIAILEEINKANVELMASQCELRESVEAAQIAADNEAILRMRSRIHDVIGQRLSILHRVLEDNEITEKSIAELKPLLNGILEDLSIDDRVSPADELAATVSAFSLTGVSVNVEGDLPEDGKRARLFAECIREAVTNAVKHARARSVLVAMSERSLEIANDGMPADLPIEEGTGLFGIREAVEAQGGTLEVLPDPFTLRIQM